MSTPILKTLKADPNSRVDFSDHEHQLSGEALNIWKAYSKRPPYWWSVHDLPTVERYCQLVAIERSLRKKFDKAESLDDTKTAWMMVKQAMAEMKSTEYSLGMTPQARAALKLSDPADQPGREKPEVAAKPMDPEDL